MNKLDSLLAPLIRLFEWLHRSLRGAEVIVGPAAVLLALWAVASMFGLRVFEL